MHTCILPHLHTSIHAHLHTCNFVEFPTCIHAYLQTCILACLHTCKLAYFIQDPSLSVSILSLMCITVERFYAVVFPFKFSFLKRHCKIVIPGVWFTGACLHAIYLKIFTLYNDNNAYPAIADSNEDTFSHLCLTLSMTSRSL